MTGFVEGSVLPSPSADRIDWFERTFDVTLPRAFRKLLATGNGDRPIRAEFTVGTRQRSVERFLCLVDTPRTHLSGWADITVVMSQIDDRLGPEDEAGSSLIPIAALFGGDFVCLDYSRSRTEPQVVVWDHERSLEFDPFTDVVARSYDEFERLLHE